MRIRIILFSIYLMTAGLVNAQGLLDPVDWSFSQEDLGNGEFNVIFEAEIDKDWTIYSQYLESDEGPVATNFEFDPGDHFQLIGKTEESDNSKKVYDKIFEMDLVKFHDRATFTQRIRVIDFNRPVTGYLTFMTCDKTRCLPPTDVDFEFTFEAPAGNSGDPIQPKEEGKAAIEQEQTAPGAGDEITSGFASDISDPGSQKIKKPVKWELEVIQKEADTYNFNFIASIDQGWNIYSTTTSEDGPVPTSFQFDTAANFTLMGDLVEIGKEKTGPDPYFDNVIVKKLLAPQVTFRQLVRVGDPELPISGYFEFMACDKTSCLPPEMVDFWWDPKTNETLLGAEAIARIDGTGVDLAGTGGVIDGNKIDQIVPSLRTTYVDPIGDCGEEDVAKGQNYLWTFVLGFLGGLLALLTPCVFPMIPLTVSFFTKGSKDRASGIKNGVIYGLSIIVIYVAIGLLITATFGATALNELSTNWIANTLFFVIFVAFAISFFGYYEITLPSSWANRSDILADKGGLLGTFFMAFTLAIVSFSCTGPIIGSAIVQSATDAMGPFVVMLGFSTALALPFGLFAAFPAWLNSLPKSGSWMNSVKVVLGFLELALALKFLSVADMTMHWNILGYEVFMAAWILIFAAMSLYLLGFIRFPHDSPKKLKDLTIPRWAFAILSLAFTVYLITGFLPDKKTGAYNSLGLMSGLAPPAHYNYLLPEPSLDEEIKAKYPSYSKCANNLDCFKDYYEGVAYAREVDKPILLDFTGYGCVNCRKTEEHIWVVDKVWNRINEDFVLISLYVDDRKTLEEILISSNTGEKLRNVGRKWADFQIVNFEQNSQPLYVMVSPDEKVLAKPRGYKEGVNDYAEFLECGLSTFSEYREENGSPDLGMSE